MEFSRDDILKNFPIDPVIAADPRASDLQRDLLRDFGGGAGGVALPTTDLLVRNEVITGSEVTLVGGGGADANDVTEWTGLQTWVQATAGDRPEYDATGGPDGGPAIKFGDESRTGAGHLEYASDIKASAGPLTIVQSYIQPSLVSSAHISFDSNTDPICYPYRVGNIMIANNGSNHGTEPDVLGSWVTVTWIVTSSFLDIYLNRARVDNITLGMAEVALDGPFGLGATRNGGNDFPGSMVNTYVWGADMTSQLTGIWDYIAANWPSTGV